MKKNKIFFIYFLVFTLIYLSNLNYVLAKKYENIYSYSLNFQSLSNELKGSIKNLLFSDDDNYYKEKYYNILKNLAQLKLAEKEKIFSESLDLLKKRFPQAEEVKVLSSNLGIIYTQPVNELTQKSFVIDENWLLVGRVDEINNNYAKILSLNYSNLRFNVSNINGEYLGLAKSTGLGYLIVDKVDSKIEINNKDLIMTYGEDDIFPPSFLVGEVVDVEIKGYFKRVKIAPLANFNSEKLIIIK
ncbi:MAG: hypothetical protein KatS3mg094_403 [Candidatus Parcubacteria bacterium]|nr:MAG: hypothetical protein KatS3mg094_403 [Candidatus Parcubacteria bacterium]